METLNKISQMSSFLKKVQQLRGFGDMDSYNLVNEFKKFTNASENNINRMIEDFSSPRTWNVAKRNLIDDVETVIGDIYNS
ncbi:hypothetical protein [Pedobacter aquatilis]|uniref:hypothetical protein n=1 Tax=Pedobacter aquatilis TaxID=351343 RepID=UPI00292F1A45|nr:hypothetical protein [Pedobacter aquatilis]